MRFLKKYTVAKLLLGGAMFYLLVIYLLQCVNNIALYNTFNPDIGSYLAAANTFLVNGEPDSIRPFGIAFFMSLPTYFGASATMLLKYIWVMQSILWLGQIGLLYAAAVKISSKKNAIIICLLFMLNGSNIILSTVPLSETLCTFLLVLSAYTLVIFYKKNNANYLALALLILCINTLVRPTFFYASILASIISIAYCIKNSKIIATCICIIGLGFLALQMQAMHTRFGNYTISYIDKMALLTYTDIRAKQYKNNSTYAQETQLVYPKINALSNKEISAFAIADFKNQLKTNGFNVLRSYLFSLWENSTTGCSTFTSIERTATKILPKYTAKILFALSRLQNIFYSFSIILLFPFLYFQRFTKKKSTPSILATSLYFFCLYIMLLSAFSFYQHDRFHIIFMPIVLLLWASFFNSQSAASIPQTRATS